MAKLSKEDMQEIMKLFDHELNLLIRMDRLEKMDLRKRINNIVLPILEMDIPHPTIFMDIVEDRLHDVFDRFMDGYEFKKKLERKVTEKLKYKRV
jgi:hypothetical protein